MIALAVSLALIASFAAAQSPSADPPLAGRPTNFSHLIGRFTIAANVDPAQVTVEDPLVLRVEITGTVAAGELPTRKRLRIFPDDLGESFHIEPVPEDDKHDASKKTWSFVWKLRPKSTDVREVPSLALAYFSPQTLRYQTARSEPLAIDVKPRVKVVVERDLPVDIPSVFFQLTPEFSMGDLWDAIRPRPVWLGLGLLAGVWGWSLGRRSVSEETADRREIVAAALTALEIEPGAGPEIVANYLRHRFGESLAEPTPGDVDRVLKRHGVSIAIRAEWTKWWQDIDAQRFAPSPPDADVERLRSRAAELIRGLEGSLRGESSRRLSAIVLAAFFAMTATAMAGTDWSEDPWSSAGEAFEFGLQRRAEGKPFHLYFKAAVEYYSRIGTQTVPVLQNRGRSAFFAGDLPGAIAAFDEAVRQDRTNSTTWDLLEYARRQVVLPPETKLVRPAVPWDVRLPWWAIRLVLPIAFVMTCVLTPQGVRSRSLRRVLLGIVAALVGLIVWAFVAVQDDIAETARLHQAIIVLREDVPFRLGNGEDFPVHPDAPILPRGYEVARLGERGGWLHVECPGGQVGWIRVQEPCKK